MNVANDDYLILKKNNPEDPTIRVVPMEQYFDTLMEIHKERWARQSAVHYQK